MASPDRAKPPPLTAAQMRVRDLHYALSGIWDVTARLAHQIEQAYAPHQDMSETECSSGVMFNEALLRTVICDAVRVQLMATTALGASVAENRAFWRDPRDIGQSAGN